MTTSHSGALRRANDVRALALAERASPVEEARRLRAALGTRSRILVKRDDAIAFGFGGNKVRKLSIVVAQAIADGADTLITVGGVQSNHARATAAPETRCSTRCSVRKSSTSPREPTGYRQCSALPNESARPAVGRPRFRS